MATQHEVSPVDLELSEGGIRIASVTFGMAFYADVSPSKMAKGTLQIFNRFQSVCGKGTLNYYSTDTMKKDKSVTERALEMLPTWLKPGAPSRDAVAVTYKAAESAGAAPQWAFMINGAETSDGTLEDEASIIRLHFPAEYGLDRHEDMLALFLELCALAPFRSAHAGFAFVCTEYGSSEKVATEHAWAKSMRHPGLDIVDVVVEMLTVGTDSIRGVDWLTFIDRRFAKQLGGAEALEKQGKKAKIDVRPLAKGLMFRAGDRPKFGDVNRGDDLPEYKAVYRMLEPLMAINFDRARSLSLATGQEPRTLDWIKRHGR